jgi:uncharacterized membrane protein YadS
VGSELRNSGLAHEQLNRVHVVLKVMLVFNAWHTFESSMSEKKQHHTYSTVPFYVNIFK